MFGKNPRLKALESRKQLLIAESELNRVHLIHEMTAMAGQVHAITNRAANIGFLSSTAAWLVAAFTTVRPEKPMSPNGKSSWGQHIAKVAGIVSAFWSTFRAQPRTKASAPDGK